jgi:hypothetical protein
MYANSGAGMRPTLDALVRALDGIEVKTYEEETALWE